MPKIMEAMVPIPERSESVHLQFEQEIVVIKSVASGSQLREDARWKVRCESSLRGRVVIVGWEWFQSSRTAERIRFRIWLL